MSNLAAAKQEEWLRILAKGMVTIPKAWRDELGLKEGEVVKARKVGNKVIIEAGEPADYDALSDEEIREWLRADRVPARPAPRVDIKKALDATFGILPDFPDVTEVRLSRRRKIKL
ncbi:MAG: AbrB/MazE/SpoVT family DNA-binding domain-containing protein [Chloroflexi bacterium]|nr:AbrB/MazE/SpoVT family DNA-binding domain-containing protein [Chloroflexota bacterium]